MRRLDFTRLGGQAKGSKFSEPGVARARDFCNRQLTKMTTSNLNSKHNAVRLILLYYNSLQLDLWFRKGGEGRIIRALGT